MGDYFKWLYCRHTFTSGALPQAKQCSISIQKIANHDSLHACHPFCFPASCLKLSSLQLACCSIDTHSKFKQLTLDMWHLQLQLLHNAFSCSKTFTSFHNKIIFAFSPSTAITSAGNKEEKHGGESGVTRCWCASADVALFQSASIPEKATVLACSL